MDLSDFEVERNLRSDCGGKREKISESISAGRTSLAIVGFRVFPFLPSFLSLRRTSFIGG